MRERDKSIFIIMFGLILWILYLCDSELSRYGIYTIFSYQMHEIMSAIPFLGIIVTIVWLIFLVARIIKRKNTKSQIFLCIFLLVLTVSQLLYIRNQYKTVTSSLIASIDTINEEKMEIVIASDQRDLTLDCPMIVLDLLKADGTEYGITYEWNKRSPHHGKLCIVQAVD